MIMAMAIAIGKQVYLSVLLGKINCGYGGIHAARKHK